MSLHLRGRLELDRAERKLQRAARQGLQEGLSCLLEESRRQVPVDTGKLRDSGHVEMDSDLSGRVTYSQEYAQVQHERTDFEHRQGKAGYFSDPAGDPAVQERMRDRLAASLRGAL